MTDRHSAYLVTLAEDLREDEAESIMNALRHIKGVLAVEPAPADGLSVAIARSRERRVWVGKILDLLADDPKGGS